MWLKTDWDFGLPWTIFTVNARELCIYSTIRDSLADGPEKLEKRLLQLIEQHRPDLKGGMVVGICLHGTMRFQVQYVHPSLPRSSNGSLPEPRRLIPCAVCGGDIGAVSFWTKDQQEMCQACHEAEPTFLEEVKR